MRFDIKRPCAHCPFRKDVPGYLHRERASELARQLVDDDLSWFACHETTGVKGGKRVKRSDQSHCMGAAMVLWRQGMPNVATRIALASKLLRVEDLNVSAPVFDSMDQFAKHHDG
jgi:hypothetical protein